MKKLWILAAANIKKNKSASVILALMFVIAALLLNAGLLVTLNYGSFFEKLKEELNPSDAYFMVPDVLYNEEVGRYFENNGHITKLRRMETLLFSPRIKSQGKDKGFNIMLCNMDEPIKSTDISQWKFVGENQPAAEMSVYVPDVFYAVSGYGINDKIVLKYDDENKIEKTLEFTVKGYTEDIYFSSTDMGIMSFYLPEDTYNKVSEILGGAAIKENIIFADLDEIASAAKIENGLRELLGFSSASLVTGDISQMLVTIDIELVELSRCSMASIISVMMVIFALIIVSVCLLVVRFRIVNSIEDDMIKIGSLKSAGYTGRQIIASILMQFGIIAGLGTVAGIILSYPFLPAVSKVFEAQSGLKWEQGFDGAVSLAALLAILVIVAAVSLFAARKIGSLSPINALRRESGPHRYKFNHMPLDKTFGRLPAVLGLKSILQASGQSVMILIIVAAVAFAGSYGIIMYYNTAIDTKAFAQVPGMEICNAIANLNPQMDHGEIIDEITNMANVRKVQYLDEVKLKVDGTDVSSYVMSDYSGKESMLVYKGHYPKNRGEIVLAGILAERINKNVGDTVSVGFNGNEPETFTVTGFSNGSQMGGMNASILAEDYKRINPAFTPETLYIYLEKGTDAAAFVKELENKFDGELLKNAMDFDKGLEEGMASYQSIVAIMGLVMLVITLAVITLVLYFVISSSVIRRRRDLGIQKAVGFTTIQLMNQIAIGFAVPVVIGVLAGSLAGAFYTNPLMSVAMRGMGVMKAGFIVDPVWVAVFGAGTIIFSYLLSLAVTWRIRKISAYALVTE